MAKGRGVSRVIGDAGLGVLGLVVGAAVFLLFQATTGGASDVALDPTLSIEAPAASVGADSPEDAVRRFLEAETSHDAAQAFDLLSEADRLAYRSAELWASRSPLGDVRSWDWDSGDGLVTSIALEPGLSLMRGWSPASSTLTWAVVDEEGWRVSLSSTTAEPLLPNAVDAVDAAGAWLSDPLRCSPTDDPRLVLSSPSAAFEHLCLTGAVLNDQTSAPVAGRVAATLESAYGPGASSWARSVPLEGGVELVLVAVGDRWVVIDALVP